MSPSPTPALCRPNAVNVAHIVERCRVLGPGERFVIWVQGCPLRCPGCHNPSFQPFVDGTWVSVANLAERVLAVRGIKGVTYVGGEPFCQPRALAALARSVRATGLSVLAYSGFTLEELRSGSIRSAADLLGAVDLLMDGRYRRDLPTLKPWRGSDNQRLIALSERYAAQVEAWNQAVGQGFELRLTASGSLEVVGVPPPGL